MSLYVVFQRMYLIWFSTKRSLAKDPGSCNGGYVFSEPPWLITVLLRARQLPGPELLTPVHGLSADYKYLS
jgi:hypothetical protein